MSPVTVMSGASLGTAVHQLPTVVGQSKSYTQMLANGPTTVKMTNGTHLEIKKELSDSVQGDKIFGFNFSKNVLSIIYT